MSAVHFVSSEKSLVCVGGIVLLMLWGPNLFLNNVGTCFNSMLTHIRFNLVIAQSTRTTKAVYI